MRAYDLGCHVNVAVSRGGGQVSAPAPLVAALNRNFLAWTGGSRPPARARKDIFYRSIRHLLFRDLCETFRDYWGDLPMDTARIFWKRASYDAWATVRKSGE